MILDNDTPGQTCVLMIHDFFSFFLRLWVWNTFVQVDQYHYTILIRATECLFQNVSKNYFEQSQNFCWCPFPKISKIQYTAFSFFFHKALNQRKSIQYTPIHELMKIYLRHAAQERWCQIKPLSIKLWKKIEFEESTFQNLPYLARTRRECKPSADVFSGSTRLISTKSSWTLCKEKQIGYMESCKQK